MKAAVMYNADHIELRKLALEIQTALIEALPLIVNVELLKGTDHNKVLIMLSVSIPGRAHPNHTHVLIELESFPQHQWLDDKPTTFYSRISIKRGRARHQISPMRIISNEPSLINDLVNKIKSNIHRIGVSIL